MTAGTAIDREKLRALLPAIYAGAGPLGEPAWTEPSGRRRGGADPVGILLDLFAGMLRPIEEELQRHADDLSPLSAREDPDGSRFVTYLSDAVGIEVPESWFQVVFGAAVPPEVAEARRRHLVAAAPELARRKGTADALRRVIALVFGLSSEVVERFSPSPMIIGHRSVVGEDSWLRRGGRASEQFAVVCDLPEAAHEAALAEASWTPVDVGSDRGRAWMGVWGREADGPVAETARRLRRVVDDFRPAHLECLLLFRGFPEKEVVRIDLHPMEFRGDERPEIGRSYFMEGTRRGD